MMWPACAEVDQIMAITMPSPGRMRIIDTGSRYEAGTTVPAGGPPTVFELVRERVDRDRSMVLALTGPVNPRKDTLVIPVVVCEPVMYRSDYFT